MEEYFAAGFIKTYFTVTFSAMISAKHMTLENKNAKIFFEYTMAFDTSIMMRNH